MNTHGLAAIPSLAQDPNEFSLVLGGPTFQLWRKTHLAGDRLQLVRRRSVVLALLAWLPLLLLSIAEGHAWGGSIKLPFLGDVEMHVRLLIAVPLLILAEVVVDQRLRGFVAQFLAHALIPPAARAQFHAAIASALRLRNSVAPELLLVGLVYGVGVLVVWRTQVALDVSSWHGVAVNGKLQPSLAGWWMGCVSLPLFQFLLLRWYFRMFVWARFLWQVAGIDELTLLPTHPDRCGGLGFLSAVSKAFAPLLVAQGMLLAAMMADRILYAGANLLQFKAELIGIVALMVFAILGPLLVFSPKLQAAKSRGLQEFGTLAERYSQEFGRKWLQEGAPTQEPLLGTPDIQSLADLASSFEIVKSMRFAPFTMKTVVRLAAITLAPVAPLLLTLMPLEQLLERMLKLVF